MKTLDNVGQGITVELNVELRQGFAVEFLP